MRITIDEQDKLVHAHKGAALLTLALPEARTREQLETAAWGLEVALSAATLIVVNGKPVTLREAEVPHTERPR